MRELERDFGVPLLERHSRGVSATAAGQLLWRRVNEVLDLLAQTKVEVAALGPDTTSVRLGLTPGMANMLSSDLLLAARAELPYLNIELVEDVSYVLNDLMKQGELDAALVYEMPDYPELQRTPLFREELLFVTAPDRARRAKKSLPSGVIKDPIELRDVLTHDLVLAGTLHRVGLAPPTLCWPPGALRKIILYVIRDPPASRRSRAGPTCGAASSTSTRRPVQA
jgi:LysR family nitrogen assimilation transcriptional regulator